MARILILDDDKKIAQALQVRLKSAGYEALAAPDPAMAVILAATHPPDLIITDIWMPIMQGFTFIRRLTSLGLPVVPFIFITASRQPHLREIADSIGAVGFFEKPYDAQELLATVARALAQTEEQAA